MSDLLTEGLTLLIMGMGTVFVFLTILVVGTTVMSRVVNRFFGVLESGPAQKRRLPQPDDLSELAAVAAGVKAVHGR